MIQLRNSYDFENMPRAFEYAIEKDYSHIFIFLGAVQNNLKIKTIKTVQLERIKIENIGKNNLDFHLSYYLGKCDLIADVHVEFVIFTGDKGLDNLIQFIRNSGRACKRISDVGENNSKQMLKTVTPPLSMELRTVIEKLEKMKAQSRPKKMKTIVNHINSILRYTDTSVTGEEIVKLLVKKETWK